jgi:CheY-like chemotaxis protein
MQLGDNESASVVATIVLAEDDSDLRAVYAQCLRQAGHVVWEAEDGAQALALVRSRSPELLLLDIWMPILRPTNVSLLEGGRPIIKGNDPSVVDPVLTKHLAHQ